MLMLKALRRRAVALLWSGQALSAIGDEIYRVALIWLAVGLVGERAGYLAAAQSGALLALSLVGGAWADRWDQRRTMIGVDALRAAIVLLPVAAYMAGRVTIPLLVLAAVSLSALSAFFDPALQATLPTVVDDSETLQAATGLMATTARLARAVGPAVVGLLAPLVPTIHFFTLDSVSFAVSAWSVARVGPTPPIHRVPEGPRETLRDVLMAGARAASSSPLMKDLMFTRCAIAGLWGLAFSLGLALVAKGLAPGDDARAFGWLVASYGVGNVLGALFVGNIRRRRPALILFSGYLWMGLGFLAMGFLRGERALEAAAFWAGLGGPVNDVPFIDLVQARFPIGELPRIFRLRQAVETASALLVLALSPALFRAYPAQAVVSACGAGMAALGAAGLWAHADATI